jgi:hypothetical protein
MATVITAGNATNGLSLSADNTGAFEFKTGTGAGTTAITVDSSQNVTFAGTAAVPTGTLYPLVSGTSVSASGTAINFTSIPSWVKRITVMFQGISLSGTSVPMVQIGAGTTPETTGYLGSVSNQSSGATSELSTTGFRVLGTAGGSNATVITGAIVINLLTGSTWVAFGSTARTDAATTSTFAYNKAITGTLGVVRVTSLNGTDTFDAGTINILYE